jgi:hypothetical protein
VKISAFDASYKLYDLAIEIYFNVPEENWQNGISHQIQADLREEVLTYSSQFAIG